jgi:hypothetical protein
MNMNTQSLSNDRRRLLMASASPGSSMAYQAGLGSEQGDVVRRNMSSDALSGRPVVGDGLEVMAFVTRRIAQFFDELDALVWSRQQASRETWLAKSQNLAELESRMRELDGRHGAPGRALW